MLRDKVHPVTNYKLHSNYTNLPKPETEIVVHAHFSEIAGFFPGVLFSFILFLTHFFLSFFFFQLPTKFLTSTFYTPPSPGITHK